MEKRQGVTERLREVFATEDARVDPGQLERIGLAAPVDRAAGCSRSERAVALFAPFIQRLILVTAPAHGW
jgi:hypothetical protein